MIEFECVLCGKKRSADPMFQFCPDCGDPMLVVLPNAPRKFYKDETLPLNRFKDFLPLATIDPALHLGEGNSPLLKLSRLVKTYDLPQVWVKNEIFNPTASFKDRGTVVAVHMAKAFGLHEIGTVSTGNMAISTAAYGAKAALQTFVFVKEDTTTEKLISAGIHGTILIRALGDYGRLSHLSFELGKKLGIYFMNSTDPFRIEGYKVIGYEIHEQLPQCPDYIIVPVSAGGHLIGLMKAFKELKQYQIIDNIPTFIGVQAQGCSPIAQAYASGQDRFERIHNPSSVAQSITNPEPPGGNVALKLIRELGGQIIATDDSEILEAQRLLAEYEGIFCLPASATVLAGLLKLHAQKTFNIQDNIVMVITGSGVKNPQALDPSNMKIYDSSLDELENLMVSLV